MFYLLQTGVSFSQNTDSNVRHFIKLESGYMHYLTNIVTVEAAPGWKGYYLHNKQNGFDVNAMYGWDFNEYLYVGLGTGYLNFQGTQGVSTFSDVDIYVSNSYVNPYFNIKLGYSHIWNQYDGGRGTFLGQFGLGVNFKFDKYSYLSFYVKSGVMLTQQSLLIPVGIGVKFWDFLLDISLRGNAEFIFESNDKMRRGGVPHLITNFFDAVLFA